MKLWAAILMVSTIAAHADDLLGPTPPLPPVDAICDADYSLVRSRAHAKWQPTLQRVGGSIALLGDSITEYMVESEISGHAVNYGVKADTLACIMHRIAASGDAPSVPLTSLHNAAAAVVMAGTNDAVLKSPATTIGKFRTLFAWLRGPLVWITVPPNADAAINAFAAEVNAGVMPLCRARPRCTAVDLWPVLAPEGVVDGSKFLDGTHPNDAGYALIYPLIRGALPGR